MFVAVSTLLLVIPIIIDENDDVDDDDDEEDLWSIIPVLYVFLVNGQKEDRKVFSTN